MEPNNTNNESSPYLESNNSNSNNNSNQINDLIEEFVDLKATYQSMLTSRDRKTIPILSKYERPRVVGERAIQISMGALLLWKLENWKIQLILRKKNCERRRFSILSSGFYRMD